MSTFTDWIHENWLWWAAFLLVGAIFVLFFKGISRMRLDRLAKLSICINMVYILLSLIFRRQLLPSVTPAFPHLAGFLISIQFAMAGMVFVRPIDKLCAPKPGGETDVDNMSILSAPAIKNRPLTGWKSVSQSEWLWVAKADGCFIAMMVVLSFFRRLTFHP